MSMDLKSRIRDVPDFPKPGIIFKDITTILLDPEALRETIDILRGHLEQKDFDLIVGIEARGFIFGAAVAYSLNKGFIPVRKPGKLPAETVRQTYDLEYGTDSIEIHKDAIKPGQKIIVLDDLLATGGTAAATVKLVESLGGKVLEAAFVVELAFLNGREKFKGLDIFSIVQY
jgi:adenine phosphoribosyltransferase